MRVLSICLLAALTLSSFTSTVAINPTARHIYKAQGSLRDLDNKMIRSAGLPDETDVAVQIGPEGMPTKPDAGEEEHDRLAYAIGSNGQQELLHDERFMNGAFGEQRMYHAPVVALARSQQAAVAPALLAPAQPPAPVALAVVAQAKEVAAAPTLASVEPAVVAQPAVAQPPPTAAPVASADEGSNLFGWIFLVIGCFMCAIGVAILIGYIGVKRFGLSENEHFKTVQEALDNASGLASTVLPASEVPDRIQPTNRSDTLQMLKGSREKRSYRRSVLEQANYASDDEDAKPMPSSSGGSQGQSFET